MRTRLETMGITHRVRNRCLLAAMSFAVAVSWLFFAHCFVSDRTGGPSALAGDDLRELRDALKSSYHINPDKFSDKFPSKGLLSKIKEDGDAHTVPEKLTSTDDSSKVGEDGNAGDVCAGRYVYLHELPREYHEGLLESCANFSSWWDMCKDTENIGFGQSMEEDLEGVFSRSGWYVTNQFLVEVIFHHKIKHYKCRTMDSSKANAIFVPFYTGMEVMRHLWDEANITLRDQVPRAVVNWLTSRPEWSRLRGHDHFLIAGRPTWDFRRAADAENGWGNNLMLLEPVKNMTTLTVEASPWHSEDFAIPYATYFHPRTDSEVLDWQDRVASMDRKSLFCFAGAARPNQDTSIRAQIISHCKESEHCALLECGKLAGKCHSPTNVIRLFKESHFCLQPSGDSYTRRSLFDAILAGCIPVLFHPFSAYTQYGWFFPANTSSYSVFINEENIRAQNVSIEKVLLSYSSEDIEAMRKVVISLIPRIIYSGPVNNSMTIKDAFDLSMEGVIKVVHEYQSSLEKKAASEELPPDLAQDEILDAKSRLDAFLKSRARIW